VTNLDRSVPQTGKSEQTRAQIVAAALKLFRENGLQGTTMRTVAAEAGVSVGNAYYYYYYYSKEELVQGYYDHMVAAHAKGCAPVFAASSDFGERLCGMLLAWLAVAEPYREFAGSFFASAAQPDSPLSPLSESSSPTRDAAIALCRELVDGSSLRVDGELAAVLPELLWLYQLGIVLY